MKIAFAAFVGLIAFVVLATANGAGYRYGVSDQIAYVPVVIRAENPKAFPRDAALLDTQGRFFVLDEGLAWVTRAGISTETAFFGAYLLSLAVVWAGVLSIGGRLYASPWFTLTFAALVTLRHHIPETSANSLEPYFHPRILALGVGMLAIGALLRRRDWLAIALVAIAAACHVTTALWFAILIGTALAVLDRRWRLAALAGVAGGAMVLAWVVSAGPLRAASATMDAVWIAAMADRRFLFANEWPASAWAANLGLLALLWWAHTVRTRRGRATAVDRALVLGATTLVAIFLVTVPAVAAHLAVAVQFQLSRVFWVVDLLAGMYGIAALGESLSPTGMRVLAAVLLTASTARGTYVIEQEHADRSLFQLSLPGGAWADSMAWVARQPLNAHILADPGHSWKYGSSVRVAAGRDVLLEDAKDSAIAMYNRDIAVRVLERRQALADFSTLDATRARALAARYDLNFLVTEGTLDLPEVYRNAQFRIYALKPIGPAS